MISFDIGFDGDSDESKNESENHLDWYDNSKMKDFRDTHKVMIAKMFVLEMYDGRVADKERDDRRSETVPGPIKYARQYAESFSQMIFPSDKKFKDLHIVLSFVSRPRITTPLIDLGEPVRHPPADQMEQDATVSRSPGQKEEDMNRGGSSAQSNIDHSSSSKNELQHKCRLCTTSRLGGADFHSCLAAVNAVEAMDVTKNAKYPSITYSPEQLKAGTIKNMDGFKHISEHNRKQLLLIIENDLDNIDNVTFHMETMTVKIQILWKHHESKFLCYAKCSGVIRRFVVKGCKKPLFKQLK